MFVPAQKRLAIKTQVATIDTDIITPTSTHTVVNGSVTLPNGIDPSKILSIHFYAVSPYSSWTNITGITPKYSATYSSNDNKVYCSIDLFGSPTAQKYSIQVMIRYYE